MLLTVVQKMQIRIKVTVKLVLSVFSYRCIDASSMSTYTAETAESLGWSAEFQTSLASRLASFLFLTTCCPFPVAWWWCNGETGSFDQTAEPDRSSCTRTWVADIENMVGVLLLVDH